MYVCSVSYLLSAVDINVGWFIWPPSLYFTTIRTIEGKPEQPSNGKLPQSTHTHSHTQTMCIAAVPTIALIYRKQRSAGKSIILLTAQEVPICEKRAVAALLDSHCFPELFSTILYRYMCGATENSALDITPVVGWIHVFLPSQHSE